ncbi:hypothetical protein [Mycobacterium sp. shizuoka-1]|uniref:hypothetical protein n=1 Tax=Mycobacterium sp. shizuoka-1 TaxID=2039281 RepID=UPI000C065659|nr:hypothetical protein [Mycobacterium sp. shizuoka-1]GAY16750.1 hypothetical protein MSZK_34760 [Mycobacterium sp. shizuoka-1]
MIDTKTRDSSETTALGDDSAPESAPAATPVSEERGKRKAKAARRISISLRGLMLTALVTALVIAVGVLGWLYAGARETLADQDRAAAARSHAEDVATDYAVNAAQMDYQDFNGWKVKLVNGTSPELKDKLTKAADSMQQILGPLQWKSTARPLAAKVRSDAGGIYTVDAFVSVLTKTMQAPDGLQSTATYSVTLDSKNNWQITDVGGIDAVVGK